MRIEIQVMDNDRVCCGEIDTHTARARGNQEEKVRGIWRIEGVYVPLTLVLWSGTIQSERKIAFAITEIFDCPFELISVSLDVSQLILGTY
jgi:hypothetical protein